MKVQRKIMFAFVLAALCILPLMNTYHIQTTDSSSDLDELLRESSGGDSMGSLPISLGMSVAEIPTSTTGDGSLLSVVEYSEGLFQDRDAQANESSTFYQQTFELPSGWETTEVTAISSKIYHLRDWVSNGDFSSITDWQQNEYPDGNSELDEQYDSLNDWIEVIRQSGGKVKYDHWGSWNQTVQVNEGGAVSATLNVTFKITTSTGTNGQNAQPYLYVNGSIYELPTNGERFSQNQDWRTYSVSLPYTEYSFPGDLDIALGIQGFADTQFQTTGTLTCDNVSLTLRTSRLAEAIDLRARDANNISNVVSFITNEQDGKGYATIAGDWSDQVDLEFLANESTEFSLDLQMPATRQNTLGTNTYSVSNGTNVEWQSTFTAREMAFPFTYDHFNVSVPSDWTLFTVYDAYDDLQLNQTTYYNATFFSSYSTLMCDVYGTGVSGTPHYGTWSIASTSHNYGDSISFLTGSGSAWIESSQYYPGSDMRVETAFLDSTSAPPDTSGSTELSFFDVEETGIYSESGEPLDGSGIATFQNGTDPSNITILSDWLAGTVTALATWSNGTAVGQLAGEFSIYHRTSLEVEAAVYSAFRGDTVTIRVKYIDTDNGLGIANAEMNYNWSYGSGVMGYAGNGWYAGSVDSSMASIGAYDVSVNASKAFYDYAQLTGITIEIQETTSLYSPKNLRIPTTDYEIAWGNSKRIYLAYEDTIAMNPTSLSADPGTPSSPDVSDSFTSNNIYSSVDSVGNEISLTIYSNVSSYGIIPSELSSISFKIEGHFSTEITSGTVYAYNFTSSTWISILQDYNPTSDTTLSYKTQAPEHFIDGDGTIIARMNASYSGAFTYDLDLFDFVANRPIDDSTDGISVTSDWPSQSSVGTQDGPFFNASLDIWEMTLHTDGVTPGEYVILIEADASGHQDKALELTIVVRAHHTRMGATPPTETPWSWQTWINVSLSDTDNSSIIINEGNLTEINIDTFYGTYTFTSSNWTYSDAPGYATIGFWLDTSDWAVNTYTIDISMITAGSGLSKSFDVASTSLDVVIRAHDIRVTTTPPSQTPWSWKTNVTITLTDLDNSSLTITEGNISDIVIGGDIYTSSDWVYSGGVFVVEVDTSSWAIGEGNYLVEVNPSSSPVFYESASGDVKISIRSHNVEVTLQTPSPTPWGQNTTLYVTLVDLDNSSLVINEGNLSTISVKGQTFTSTNWIFEDLGTYARITLTLVTDDWIIQQHSLDLSLVTTGSGDTKFYGDASTESSVSITSHTIVITVFPPADTPWGFNTTLVIQIMDLDADGYVSESNITSITINGQVFTSSNWSYAQETHVELTVNFVTDDFGVSNYNDLSVNLVTTGSGSTKFFTNAESTVDITIRSHNTRLTIVSSPTSPWGTTTDISLELDDLDQISVNIPEGQIDYLNVSGVIYTSVNFTYVGGVLQFSLDTSDYLIGDYSKNIEIYFVGSPANYSTSSVSTIISIKSHSLNAEALRPAATPYNENTTFTIRIRDGSVTNNIISSDNISQIVVDGQVITTWVYDNGNFTITLQTNDWDIGVYSSLTVELHTTGSGVTKFYLETSTSVTIEIRNRYSEAYSPAPDPVPLLDNLSFYVYFKDRDSGGAQVNFTNLYLNGTDLTENTDFWVTWISEGYYLVEMSTSGLDIGDHQVIATCVREGYENATATIRYTIRLIETSALASGYNFNVPLDTNLSLTIQFQDIDHSENILDASIDANWSSYQVTDVDSNGIYEILIITDEATSLGSYIITFNITKPNYEDGYVSITIKVETHATYLSFDEAVVSTGIDSNITAALFYEDLSLGIGITNTSGNIIVDVTNPHNSSAIFYVEQNSELGDGHYLILIPADQFGGIGIRNFTVYFNWTGSLKYENLWKTFNVEITGTETDLTVSISPQSVYYGDLINFTLLYKNAENGQGIVNGSSDVWGFADLLTAGESVTSSDFSIFEVNRSTDPGEYRVLLNSSLLSTFGEFTIRVWLNWSSGVSPLYENQTLDITVSILVRSTLLDVNPPQNTAYDENATFTFVYYDSPTNTRIENSSSLSVTLENPGLVYFKTYNESTLVWTIIIQTSSLSSTGDFSLSLKVTWSGAPFYQNRTKSVALTVTERPSQLTYTAPVPTYYSSNVTIEFEYVDLIDDSSSGLNGNNITLTSPGLNLTGYYDIIDNGDGSYTAILNSSAFLEPETYEITATISYNGSRYVGDASTSFNFKVLYRPIVAIADPVGSIAWLSDIEITLHLSDGETSSAVYNSSGGVRINLGSQNSSSAGLNGIITLWTNGTDTYSMAISNTLGIGTYVIYVNISYDYTEPFYGYRVIEVPVTIRRHATEVQLDVAPTSTGYGLNTTFQLFYKDLDEGTAIDGGSLIVQNSSLSGNWTITDLGSGFYGVDIDSNAFDSIGTYWVQIDTQNTGSLENYQNSTILVRVYIRERYTLLTYDPVPSTAYTDTVVVTIYYTDSDYNNAGINNSTHSGTVYIGANASDYTVYTSAEAGTFTIEMPASQFTPFVSTPVEINVTYLGSPYFQDQTMVVSFEVRGTYTEFTWDPSNPVPYGDRLNLTFYWGDSDTDSPVDAVIDQNMSVVVECTTQPSLNTTNPDILLVVQGTPTDNYARFFLLLNTSYLDGYGVFKFKVTLNWTDPNLAPYYEDQLDKVVSANIRIRDTAVPQINAASVPFGYDVTVLLEYVDLDNESSLVSGDNLTLSVLDGISYTVNYTPNAQGFYEIYIATAGTDLVGSIRFNLSATWYGAPYFENQTALSVTVSITKRIASMEITFPEGVSYLDIVSFTIQLQDTHSGEWIDSNLSYIYTSFLSPSGVTVDANITEVGGGEYRIEFNSTILEQVGGYEIRVAFNHSQSAPYYSLISRDVVGSVTERATNLDYDPPTAIPYGNYMIFNLTYTDVDSTPSEGITNASIFIDSTVTEETPEDGVNYWITNLGNGVYQVNISTVALGAPTTYEITLIANSTSEWWLTERVKSVNVRVDYRTVEIDVTAPDATYFEDVTQFQISLLDIDNGTEGSALEGMSSYLSVVFVEPSGLSNSSIIINDEGSGLYTISFDTGILPSLDDYRVVVEFRYGEQAYYWDDADSGTIRGRILARLTQMTYDIPSTTPYLDNVTISVSYEDLGNSTGISAALITLLSSESNDTLELGVNYWITETSQGVYEILLDSVALGNVSEFVVNMTVKWTGSPYYVNKSASMRIEIRERSTRFTFTPVGVTAYSDDAEIYLKYADVDADLAGIEGAETYISLDLINGSSVNSSYYTVAHVSGGSYLLTLNTSKLSIYGYYELTISISGMNASHYQGQTILVSVEVRARSTQLSTAPIAQTSYTENATIALYFTDTDASVGITNSSDGIEMSLNTTVDWWVREVTPGSFELLINVTQLNTTGSFAFKVDMKWIAGKPFYSNQTLTFTVTVSGSRAVLSYIPPQDVPIGDDIVITVTYEDSATGNGISNSSENIHVSFITLNATPVDGFQYILTIPEDGRFVFTINSTPFWATGSIYFVINVTWTEGVVPYYQDINGTQIRAVVRNIYTQAYADAPDPGTVPINDNISVVVTYNDLDHDVNIESATLTTDWPSDYTYFILPDGRFNVTLMTAGLSSLGKITVTFTFNKTFYQTKSTSAAVNIRLISTGASSTTPEPAIVPIGDTVTFEIAYFDIDHSLNITDPTISSDWAFGWDFEPTLSETFLVTLYTENVTNMVQYTVEFTLTKANYTEATTKVRIEVRQIRTSITIDIVQSIPAGNNVTVTVTYEDTDHEVGIEGASLLSDASNSDYDWTEDVSGVYSVEFYVSDFDHGVYTYLISAFKQNYDLASINVDINIRQVATEISATDEVAVRTWGEEYPIAVSYDRLDLPLGPVANATVRLNISTQTFDLVFNGTTYNTSIDTTLFDVGTYILTVSANKSNYESRILQITLVIEVLQTEFEEVNSKYSYSISSGTPINITVFLWEENFGYGVSDATVTYSWDYGDGSFLGNGTAGYYTASIDTTGATVNTYTLYVRANKSNHAEASIYFSIDIRLIQTDLDPIGVGSYKTVYGENITISLEYIDTGDNSSISNGSVSFRFGDINYIGVLNETESGTYDFTIETSRLYAGSFTIYVSALKPGYETATVTLLLDVSRIETSVSPLTATRSIVYGNSVSFYFNYTDIYNSVPIENATIEYRWAGGTGELDEEGTGIYRVDLDSILVGPGVFDIYVTAFRDNFQQRTGSATLEVRKISTKIIGPATVEIPVGDSRTLQFLFNDTVNGESIQDATAVATWLFGNPELNVTNGGNYTFTVPGSIDLGNYPVTLIMSKANYTTSSLQVTVIIRKIRTELVVATGNDVVSGTIGEAVSISLVYNDLDHDLPITGAIVEIADSGGNLDANSWSVTETGTPGEYLIEFAIPIEGQFEIVVNAEKGEEYVKGTLTIDVIGNPVVIDPLFAAMYYGGSIGIILLLIGALLYVKVFSVPKMIRNLNGMIKDVSKGKVPEAPEVKGRSALIAGIVNEGLEPVNLSKPLEEIPEETIEFKIPEIEELLEELAEITGLTEEDIAVFKQDLASMRPSERPGFLNEVIRQERARRAKDVAEKEMKEEDKAKISDEELQEVRERLLAIGIAEEEVDLMMENAKELSKSEIDALLDNLDV